MNRSHIKWIGAGIGGGFVILSVTLYLVAARLPTAPSAMDLYDGTISIFFRPGVPVSPQRTQEIVSMVGGSIVFRDAQLNMVVIRINPPPKSIDDADTIAKQLEREPEVEWAGPAMTIPVNK